MTKAIDILKATKDRLDQSKSDPKWLNEEIIKAITSLTKDPQGQVANVALNFTEELAEKQVIALNKFTAAIREQTATNVQMHNATMNAPLKKSSIPRDANYVALSLFNIAYKHAVYNNENFEETEAANEAWDIAEEFIKVSQAREAARIARIKAAQEEAKAAAAEAAAQGS